MEQEVIPQVTQEGGVANLTAQIATPGIYFGAKIHLFKLGYNPTPLDKLADFVAQECDFGGYNAVSLTYSAVGIDGTGLPRAVTGRAFFQATDAVTPQVAGGFWIDSPGTATQALLFGNFGGGGISFEQALRFAAITLTLGPDGPVTADVES